MPDYTRIYELENQLLKIVAFGESTNAKAVIKEYLKALTSFENTDDLRSLKNMCIGLNSLLRKAAEKNKVYPTLLTDTFLQLTDKISSASNRTDIEDIVDEIVFSYLKLVKSNTNNNYSTPVIRAIIKIDSDLKGDNSLSALAQFNNISAGYFSGLFKTEIGTTLTDYVNKKRIDHAKLLLKTTKLQIKKIANECGISDINYFTKLFKKYEGMSPSQFREDCK